MGVFGGMKGQGNITIVLYSQKEIVVHISICDLVFEGSLCLIIYLFILSHSVILLYLVLFYY